MEKLLIFLNIISLILIPIVIFLLYETFAAEINERIPEEAYEIAQEVCGLEQNIPETRPEIEFLEKNYQSVIDQKDGNVGMSVFKNRLNYVAEYRPEIKGYLDTKNFRYHLPEEAIEKLSELFQEDSYSHTVNNIHEWIDDNVVYIYNREWYTAQSTWKQKSANCNGISFLTCGMMREAGIPCVVVANDEHAWTEYLYVDDYGRLVWSIWDQGLEGYPALSENVYEYSLN
jgi:hypothetical protein